MSRERDHGGATKVYVGDLPPDATEREIEKEFTYYGRYATSRPWKCACVFLLHPVYIGIACIEWKTFRIKCYVWLKVLHEFIS